MKNKDSHIIELLFARSESALEMIRDLYGRLMSSVAFNVTKSDTTAEECLNDTLLDIWNTIPPERPESVGSYACMIARRRAIDRIRHDTAKKRYTPESEYASAIEELAFMDDFSDDVVNKMDLSRIIDSFLDELSSTNREIFVARYYAFESVESVGRRLKMSPNTVSVRLSRMRGILAEKMKKEGITV